MSTQLIASNTKTRNYIKQGLAAADKLLFLSNTGAHLLTPPSRANTNYSGHEENACYIDRSVDESFHAPRLNKKTKINQNNQTNSRRKGLHHSRHSRS